MGIVQCTLLIVSLMSLTLKGCNIQCIQQRL
jgi:hypothetical protein